MSRTTHTTTSTRALRQSGSILLSPSKRRRLSDNEQDKSIIHRPSEKEIWEWILASSPIAKCYIRDILNMPRCKDFDFYWLGSTPCRKVEICGIIVGIQVLEKKILYTVDDGTEVMDCAYTLQQISQSKNLKTHSAPLELSAPPQPIRGIGRVIKVSGKIQRKHETRHMIVDEISSSSFGAQLEHWQAVRGLHETCYGSSEPFVIPVVDKAPETPRKSQKKAAESAMLTPSIMVGSSPTTIASSPVKPSWEPRSPPKLRHPSRLRAPNLTDNAFRIYVKHFISNAPEDSIKNESDSDEDLGDLYKPARIYTSQILGTSTNSPTYENNATPRPQTRTKLKRPSLTSSNDKTRQGFTLSYLRRVRELSLMATRVVRQRARELDKKAQETASQSTSKPTFSNQHVKRIKLDRAGLAAKKKRLFQWAICELLRDGSIVLWDGPKRPCQDENIYENPNASMLWKYSSSVTVDSSLFSNASSSRSADDDDGELSDQDPDEEAYISTRPELLAPVITEVLKALALAPPRRRVVKRNELIGGSTKEDVLEYLRRDDRWAFIGEWNITETLEYMVSVGLAWNPSGEQWLAMG